jgi:hypothetical protein
MLSNVIYIDTQSNPVEPSCHVIKHQQFVFWVDVISVNDNHPKDNKAENHDDYVSGAASLLSFF